MAVFWETFQSLFPLYFYILLGALLGRTGLLPQKILAPLNRLVFVLFISAALFVSVYETDLHQAFDPKAMAFAFFAVLIQAGLGMAWALKAFPSRPQATIVGQTVYRSNFALHGIVYGTLLYGAANIGTASLLIALIVPLYNILSVITFEAMKGERPKASRILLNVLQNPLVLAVALALLLKASPLTLPPFLMSPLASIAQAATPLSLILAGSALTFQGLKANRRPILWGSGVRLLIVPLLFVPLAILLGFRDLTLVAILVAFGGPVATPLPSMAYQAGGDGDLASQLVAVTSFLSLFSLHLFIALLKALNLC